MHTKTVTELCASLRQREFSATELARSLLARISAAQPALNAFISVESESALAAAAAADRLLARRRCAGPDGCAPRPQGSFLCRRLAHHLRVTDAGQLRIAL